jgi:hypothetical protein
VAGYCECGNETSGSIKCGEFLDYLELQLACQEGLCYVGLMSVVNQVIVCWLLGWLVGWLVNQSAYQSVS